VTYNVFGGTLNLTQLCLFFSDPVSGRPWGVHLEVWWYRCWTS